jgi:hypothetical protein
MSRYQVKLFKDLLSSDGHPFHCLQSISDIEADGPDSAVRLVLKEMRCSDSDWSITIAPLQEGTSKSPN